MSGAALENIYQAIFLQIIAKGFVAEFIFIKIPKLSAYSSENLFNWFLKFSWEVEVNWLFVVIKSYVKVNFKQRNSNNTDAFDV